jgi:hypothetical protein
MFSKMKLRFGSSPGYPHLELGGEPSVTIFVGPNNSGKSLALREIQAILKTGNNGASAILDDISFTPLSLADATAVLEEFSRPPNLGEAQIPDHTYFDGPDGRIQVYKPSLINALTNPNNQDYKSSFCAQYMSRYVLSLDGPSRVQLINPQLRGDLKNPQTAFAKLFVDNPMRSSLRSLIHKATSMYIALDASEGDVISMRYGLTPPPNERSLEDVTLDYLKDARDINEVSDGVKAFTGILLQLHVGRPKIIIVDEPEAFLHPTLAHTLGKELAKGAFEEGKHVFASTHSAQFLMGAISSGAKINIVRLTYKENVGTARLLPSEELKTMMLDPLLRSVGVLNGLFYDQVVVGEADADRAFYQEINERLLEANDWRGAPRTLFLNADNKQTVSRIVGPLRKLGIPTASIVDIDVLKEGGNEWTRHLKAIGIPQGEHQAYGGRRSKVLEFLEAANPEFKINGGVRLLAGQNAEMANNLLDDLARYGMFVVPQGEVENWLEHLDVPRTKQKWLRKIFDKMGSDPQDANYVRPDNGDVWDFMGKVQGWYTDGERRGIPH